MFNQVSKDFYMKKLIFSAMKLSKDDLELTLKELKNQRVQLTIQLLMVESGVRELTGLVAAFGK